VFFAAFFLLIYQLLMQINRVNENFGPPTAAQIGVAFKRA
jgi:hypothetical protein